MESIENAEKTYAFCIFNLTCVLHCWASGEKEKTAIE